MGWNKFTYVVSSMDTPDDLSIFMKNYFKDEYHQGCVTYTPEEFFKRKKGDRKDYAVFSSYVLKQHGFDVNILVFSVL